MSKLGQLYTIDDIKPADRPDGLKVVGFCSDSLSTDNELHLGVVVCASPTRLTISL